MSETWEPGTGSNETPPAGPAAPPSTDPSGAGATAAAPQTGAIPLPPAGVTPGQYWPSPEASPYQTAPTAQQPGVGSGPPTPPSGTWPPPPYGWGPGATGGAPSYLGWPPPDPTRTPAAPKRSRGLVVSLVAVVIVVAAAAGAGLGHTVWPSSSTASATVSPNTGTGGSSGSSGSFPFGNGSSGSGSNGGGSYGGGSFGNGSSGSGTSTGAGAPSDISAIAAKVDPGLVDINTNLSYQDEQAAGTGMVLTSTGEILTNNHVIDGATSISVTDVGNGKTYSAKVVGYDRTGDVAVIKLVGASGLQTVTTSGGTAAVGQAVVGVGNAGGTGGTPSAAGGSITALNQSITASDDDGGNSESLSGLIEVNAGIEPGDSGGSLVDTQGQVLGMDTAASADSGYQVSATQAYAIPIETALSIALKIDSGQASPTVHIGATGFLGVGVGSSSDTSGGFGADGGNGGTGGGDGSTTGAVVSQVLSNSAAGQAGVVDGDVITAVNGKAVNSPSDLSNLLEPEHPGDVVQLQWTNQSGQTQTAAVTLGSGPPA
jgi:S1-C subfamily serine protease